MFSIYTDLFHNIIPHFSPILFLWEINVIYLVQYKPPGGQCCYIAQRTSSPINASLIIMSSVSDSLSNADFLFYFIKNCLNKLYFAHFADDIPKKTILYDIIWFN